MEFGDASVGSGMLGIDAERPRTSGQGLQKVTQRRTEEGRWVRGAGKIPAANRSQALKRMVRN